MIPQAVQSSCLAIRSDTLSSSGLLRNVLQRGVAEYDQVLRPPSTGLCAAAGSKLIVRKTFRHGFACLRGGDRSVQETLQPIRGQCSIRPITNRRHRRVCAVCTSTKGKGGRIMRQQWVPSGEQSAPQGARLVPKRLLQGVIAGVTELAEA